MMDEVGVEGRSELARVASIGHVIDEGEHLFHVQIWRYDFVVRVNLLQLRSVITHFKTRD